MGKVNSIAVSGGAADRAEKTGDVTPITGATRARKGAGAAQAPAATETATPAVEASLVVFGKDDSGKPHASWFGATDAEMATKAAGLMRFRVLPITTNEHRAAASGLAARRVFASGKGFVPFCKEAAHAALEAFGEAFQPPAPIEPEPEPAPLATGTPQRWEDIGTGSLVLANDGGAAEGWYEAIVIEVKPEDLVILKWRDWPDNASFVRRPDGLALLPARSVEVPASS